MKPFAAGIICLLATIPWSARAQDEAPNGSDAHAAVEGGAPAAPDPLVEQTRRLEARVRALEERPVESQSGLAPAPAGRRTVGLGLAGGGGVLATPTSAGVLPLGGADAIVIGQLPSVEARFFLANGMSVDLSLPVGDILARPLRRGAGLAFTSELFWNFNPRVTAGLHLVLGPGVGFTVSQPFATGSGSGAPETRVTYGEVRFALEAGVELLAAGGHLGLALLARPRASIFMWDDWPTTRAIFVGGVVGLLSVNYYFLAR